MASAAPTISALDKAGPPDHLLLLTTANGTKTFGVHAQGQQSEVGSLAYNPSGRVIKL